MTSTRDFGAELDALKQQMEQLQELVRRQFDRPAALQHRIETGGMEQADDEEEGEIFYSGYYRNHNFKYRWGHQERNVSRLLDLDGDKAAKILAALGHKQRLDILRTVLKEPLTGAELVERLNMGTTGQLYHHIKALLGADLLRQEERGGKYSVPGHRSLPLLLLLAASSDLLDASNYIDMADARNNAGVYLGSPAPDGYDPHLLLWSILENSILEHRAGYCSEVNLFLHQDGSITVSDNGRGIPVSTLPQSRKTKVETVLTDMQQYRLSASYSAPGSEKGISVPVVNALSFRLSVEVRRDGRVYRQDYKYGVPQTDLLTVGVTDETGTSITFEPDRDIFTKSFDINTLQQRISELAVNYPDLRVRLHSPEET
ncbi:ATP-binding protein [Paenibacillus alkalitolerans]|uniref:ATP-binding protein n=1 Tax=Paenibacillus alkalitolerans TaxID=2799335 RepID=UPI0018F34AEB|nr:ATP-binding protein [Paenibacillus alkalitolerans]